MTTGQTSFSKFPDVAREGMRADGGLYDAISKVLTDAAGIGPGRLVKAGTEYGSSCAALTATGDVENGLGFTEFDFSKEPTTPHHELGDRIRIVRKGRIWLTCVDDMSAVAEGSIVHVVYSGSDAGRPQLSGVGADLCEFLRLLKGGAASALGLFEINL